MGVPASLTLLLETASRRVLIDHVKDD